MNFRSTFGIALSGGCWPFGPGRNLARALSAWRPRRRYGSVLAMMMQCNQYLGFRFPVPVMEHAVWLYHCFSLNFRDVETVLAACGIVVSSETIRDCGLRLGRAFANALRRRRPRQGDKWQLDEVFIRICDELHDLWRAVDQDGNVLDIRVQSRRDIRAAFARVATPVGLGR